MNHKQVEAVRRSQAVTTAAALLAAGAFALFWPTTVGMRLSFVAAAGAALFLRSVPLVWLLVFYALVAEIIPGPDGWWIRDHASGRDLAAASALLAFVVFALRDLELRGRSGPGRSGPGPQDTARLPLTEIRPWTGLHLRLPLAIAGAWLALALVPLQAMYPNPPHMLPSVLRSILFFWGFGLAAVVASVWFSVWRWRRMLTVQARAHVHRIVADELRSERHGFARARMFTPNRF